MNLTAYDIAEIVGGTLSGVPDVAVDDLATDSRQLGFTGNVMFVAINGVNHDGHQFIEALYRRGVRAFLVDRLPGNMQHYAGSAFIIAENTVDSLQRFAAWKRRAFHSPVIGITGSAGKTTVKEWLADVISQYAPVIRSPRSYNSQTGVPLSVWKLDGKYRFGIFEAGISQPAEMEKLRAVIEPDIGVITNIGDAHSENFSSKMAKAVEKLKLFRNSPAVIYCYDHEIIRAAIEADENMQGKELVSWSETDRRATIFVKTAQQAGGNATLAEVEMKGKNFLFTVPFTDRASVENAITVAAVCLYLNIDSSVIASGLSKLVAIPMRMEMKAGINNCRLIEDCYNSDPGSLKMALDFLKSHRSGRTVLILSDFMQSGMADAELYGEVARLVRKTDITRFIGIGAALSANKHLFRPGDRFYDSTGEFIRNLLPGQFNSEVILLKGARVFEFEKIGQLLQRQVHQTRLEINLDAISHNLNVFRKFLHPGTKIMAMVKAFAYGAGAAEIASFLEFHRVNYLAVACTDEGIDLCAAGVTLPIMVLNPDPSTFDMMIEHALEPELYSAESFDAFVSTAGRHGLINYPVHIKIDTGMHRLGFLPEEIDGLAGKIKGRECIKIVSVFSHLAGSDSPALDSFSKSQFDAFLSACSKLRAATGYPFMRHILNSSGIVRMPQHQLDMVRPGIGIYGAGSFDGTDLRPAGRFSAVISQIKTVKAGEPVGYDCADVSVHNRQIAVLPVGYADGLRRKMGNGRGGVFIKGVRVPTVGNVCMDMCMADVTGTGATVGDEAEIFGENISINEVAAICETIPYEILTSITGRVKRVFLRE
ncbi:MAG: bifunctional UDP-N-acetylmuramoyl-tripeptide:D-alanyl-D-alanine ligase/alanine racemase [Bacteroidales bacterium]|jgi:alanine racemase|nr:bifunctional UDP-N-acetylmuramoyl-tripeptide:D-alanyl-D-alanine ligase/alanine racemase [Bacteroidales bacterium]